MFRPLTFQMPSILWAAFILVLSLMPGRDLPSVSLWQADKLAHFAVYAILTWLMLRGAIKQLGSPLRLRVIVLMLLLSSGYGVLIEFIQETFTADRHLDWYDAIANATGALMGSVGAWRRS